MHDDIVINCEDVTKSYKLFERPVDRVKETFHPFRKKYHHTFNALKNVSFTARKGESIGFIGKNGSGKSTLLQIVSGILKPSSGIVNVSGKISALLELGAGFNPEFTGRQNVYLNASILGLKKRETDRIFDEIVEFAEIGDFMDQPVKTYSSGMRMRLAFAVQASVDPGIMLVDEVLAVGDIRFAMKCLRKMQELRKRGTAFLFVSHDISSLINFCGEVIWLDSGKIMQKGNPKDITLNYSNYMTYGFLPSEIINTTNKNVKKNVSRKNIVSPKDKKDSMQKCRHSIPTSQWIDLIALPSTGEGGAMIERIAIINKDGKSNNYCFEGGEDLDLFMEIFCNVNLHEPVICADFRDTKGNLIFGLNTYFIKKNIQGLKSNTKTILNFSFKMPLIGNGNYSISVAIADGDLHHHVQHHIINEALLIKIQSSDLRRYHYLCAVDDIELSIIDAEEV